MVSATKLLLLVVALRGLGDDNFATRKRWEKYLGSQGYVAVPLKRAARWLTDDMQTLKTLRALEKRYYAPLDNLTQHDFPPIPMLAEFTDPITDPSGERHPGDRVTGWGLFGHEWNWPLTRLARHYINRAQGPDYRTRVRPQLLDQEMAATMLLVRDLRRLGVPRGPVLLVLDGMRWRERYLLRYYRLK